jgi:hypothetical protein
MDPYTTFVTRPQRTPATAAAASMWFRFGFFGGLAVVAWALTGLSNGDMPMTRALLASMLGIVLSTFALHRAWRLVTGDAGWQSPAAGLLQPLSP